MFLIATIRVGDDYPVCVGQLKQGVQLVRQSKRAANLSKEQKDT